MLKRVIYPFILAASPVLVYYYQHLEFLSPFGLILSVLVSVLFAFLVYQGFKYVFKDAHRAAIFVSFFLFCFFIHGHATDTLYGQEFFGWIHFSRQRHLLTLWAVILMVVGVVLFVIPWNLVKVTKVFNMACIVLLLTLCVATGFKRWKLDVTFQEYSLQEGEVTRSKKLVRDIYFIVMDSYANSKTLKQVFDYDNQDFEDYLKNKDFYIVSEARSNYASTILSLSSTLDMRYAHDPNKGTGTPQDAVGGPYDMIANGRVVNFAKSLGYKFFSFQTDWIGTHLIREADYEIMCGAFHEPYLDYLTDISMLRYVIDNSADKADRINCMFDELKELPKYKVPKFVLAHFLLPHPPYVFKRNGDVHEEETLINDKVCMVKEHYLEQLIYTNRQMKQVIEEILSKSRMKPIIILASDHGSDVHLECAGEGGWRNPPDKALQERMRSFNALYLPEVDKSELYQTMTPVNTFRVVLNAYFGTDFRILDDRSYFSNYEAFYKLDDVTDRVLYDK